MKQDDMRASLSVASVVVIVFLAWTTACSENIAPRPTGVDSLPNIVGLTISAPIAGTGALHYAHGPSTAGSVETSVVYVSLAPGSVGSGLQASIRDNATGQSITVDVLHGGFDPVAIPAAIGDTLIIDVTGTSAGVNHAIRVVAKRRPPVVVRTDPPPRKRDVPLNSIVVVVFSEPLDPATVSTSSVSLLRGTAPIAGTVRFADVEHLRVEFHPVALLAAETDYRLVLSREIRDVSGVALADAVTVPFTTGSSESSMGLAFAMVSAGSQHACGVTTDGSAYCWGPNDAGQLGDGTTTNSTTPVRVAGGLTFRSVSAGYSYTCGVTTDSVGYCWGLNFSLNDPPSTIPKRIAGQNSFATVSVGGGSVACGVTASGKAYCWGDGSSGSLGAGSAPIASGVPIAVAGGLTFATVSAGSVNSCGVTTAGKAYCWGNNTYGALGIGTSTGPAQCINDSACSATPIAVTGGLTFAQVEAEAFSVCGITTTGAGYCWGDNSNDRLGLGTEPAPEQCASRVGPPHPCSRVPVAVPGLPGLVTLSAAYSYTCGLTWTGVAYCWGDPQGSGSLASILRSGAVPGGLTFRTLSAGENATCGVTTLGVAYCWGDNAFGQLGDGTTTSSSVPVRVAGQDTRPLQRVQVTIVTTGVSLDPNGYGVLNDEWDYDVGDGLTLSAPTNGTVNLYLRPGGHILSLIDIASNCSGERVADRSVDVALGAEVTRVEFRVVCTPL